MSRFQALTNAVLDKELEQLRDRLGLLPSQKADLLREVAWLASWVVQQTEQGRTVEARSGNQVERLVHPGLERIRRSRRGTAGERVALTDVELARLADVLDRGFHPTAALRKALANLASRTRRAPKLRWKKSAA